jgi:hypothetical protein
MKIRIGIMFSFTIDEKWRSEMLYIINGHIREVIEQHLPAGWAMKVVRTEVNGQEVKNEYS